MTEPTTVGDVLGELVACIRDVLRGDLVGVYLYGSYVSGGYDPGVSDLDVVAVTSNEIERLDLAGLDLMHSSLVAHHPDWDERIEVVYVNRAALATFRTSRSTLAVISPGEPFHLRHERPAEWVQNWYLVRETGLTLHGPDPATIVPPIPWTEFAAAAAHYADHFPSQNLDDARPGALQYAVLTMCRAYRTVVAQTHGTKQEGAAWTRERLPEWGWLIDEALACRLSRGTLGLDDERTRAEAVRFVRLVAAQIAATG